MEEIDAESLFVDYLGHNYISLSLPSVLLQNLCQ